MTGISRQSVDLFCGFLAKKIERYSDCNSGDSQVIDTSGKIYCRCYSLTSLRKIWPESRANKPSDKTYEQQCWE